MMHTDAGWDPDLQALLERICEEIARAGESEFRAGTLLLEAKALVRARKQSWLEFVKDAGLEERTTQRLMKVAAYEPYQNPSTLSEMPSDYTTRGVLTGLTEDEFHTRLDAGVIGSGLTFKQAEKMVWKAKRERLLGSSDENPMPPGVRVVQGDLRDILPTLEDESVNLFMCDLPYPKDYEYLYLPLAEQAARLLVPGGSLVALHGQRQVLSVGRAFSKHLTLNWQLVKSHKGNLKPLREYDVAAGFTPGLWFVKGDKPVAPHRPMDLLHCDEDHDFHEWGQDIAWYDHYIEKLTKPGDMVVDPTCGAGTCLVAAARLGRACTGIDLNPEAIEVTRRRLYAEDLDELEQAM